METLQFDCEVITPMFLAGADTDKPEIRPASIKGMLRFWWRALYGSNPNYKKREAEIFGGTGENEGRSKVLLRVKCGEINPGKSDIPDAPFFSYISERRPNGYPTKASVYLAYGLTEYDKNDKKFHFIRNYVPVGTTFQVIIKIPDVYKEEVIQSFLVLQKFGALGAKSRNGYGCFSINKCFLNNKETQLKCLEIINNTDPLPFSAFSNKSVLLRSNNIRNSWQEALRDLGIAYQHARESLEDWHIWENRELIAQPIIVRNERTNGDNFLSRHSKPYFMHIRKEQNRYRAYILVLPVNYLEGNSTNFNFQLQSVREDYFDVITDFNSHILSKQISKVNINS